MLTLLKFLLTLSSLSTVPLPVTRSFVHDENSNTILTNSTLKTLFIKISLFSLMDLFKNAM